MISNGRCGRCATLFLLAMTMLWTTACAHQGDAGPEALCALYAPVYLSDGEIAALERTSKVTIASNNLVWEEACLRP